MRKLSASLASIELSHVARMNARVNAEKRPDVIRLAGGEPSLPLPGAIFEGIEREPRFRRYSPIDGFPDLLALLSRKLAEVNGIDMHGRAVVCTPGGCGGLFLSFRAVLDPGDEVLIPDPCWEYMKNIVMMAGGAAKKFRMAPPGASPAVDLDSIEATLTDRTAAIAINTPLNPTGQVLDRDTLAALAELCRRRGLWLVADEITEAFVYDGRAHVSPALLYEGTIVVHSFSKSYGLTGLRLGYVAAPDEVAAQIRKAMLYTVMYPSSVAQAVALTLLSGDHVATMRAMRETFERRRDLFVAGLARLRFVSIDPPQGGLFVLPRFDLPAGDGALHDLVYERCSIATAPGFAFGSGLERNLRMFMGVEENVIAETVDRLGRLHR